MEPSIDGDLTVDLMTSMSHTNLQDSAATTTSSTRILQEQQSQIDSLQSELKAAQDAADKILVHLIEAQAALSSEQETSSHKDEIIINLQSTLTGTRPIHGKTTTDSGRCLHVETEQKLKETLEELQDLHQVVDFYKRNCAEVSLKVKELAAENDTLKESLRARDQRIKDQELIISLLPTDTGRLKD